jgi:hypothetical protein
MRSIFPSEVRVTVIAGCALVAAPELDDCGQSGSASAVTELHVNASAWVACQLARDAGGLSRSEDRVEGPGAVSPPFRSVLNPPNDHLSGALARLQQRDPYCGQAGRVRGGAHVVSKPHDRHVAGHCEIAFSQRSKHAHRRIVVRREQRRVSSAVHKEIASGDVGTFERGDVSVTHRPRVDVHQKAAGCTAQGARPRTAERAR